MEKANKKVQKTKSVGLYILNQPTEMQMSVYSFSEISKENRCPLQREFNRMDGLIYTPKLCGYVEEAIRDKQ